MALNLQTFRTRSITAAVFVIVMLLGLLWDFWSFIILFSIIHFGCWTEFQKLLRKIRPEYSQVTVFHQLAIMFAGWLMMFAASGDQFEIGGRRLNELGWYPVAGLVFCIPWVDALITKKWQGGNYLASLLGLLYISLPLTLMINLRSNWLGSWFGHEIDYGWIIPLVMISAIWINDTMAYVVGSLIGKTPFSKISPKKTWEGSVGGAVLAILVVTLVMHWILPDESLETWIVISGCAAIAGTTGDLFESKLKRLAAVKDSGHIMPGHGGFLDRFDSLLFTVPFVWAYVHLAL